IGRFGYDRFRHRKQVFSQDVKKVLFNPGGVPRMIALGRILLPDDVSKRDVFAAWVVDNDAVAIGIHTNAQSLIFSFRKLQIFYQMLLAPYLIGIMEVGTVSLLFGFVGNVYPQSFRNHVL